MHSSSPGVFGYEHGDLQNELGQGVTWLGAERAGVFPLTYFSVFTFSYVHRNSENNVTPSSGRTRL